MFVYHTAQNRRDNFPSYTPDNSRCSDDVYLREAGATIEKLEYRIEQCTSSDVDEEPNMAGALSCYIQPLCLPQCRNLTQIETTNAHVPKRRIKLSQVNVYTLQCLKIPSLPVNFVPRLHPIDSSLTR